jgi:selenocysteine lyase/cysteine desulfurase
VRRFVARLLRSHAHEIAFTANTSDGLSAVASGLNWRKGDIVLTLKSDFPANIYPWLNLARHGVDVHYIERKKGRFSVTDIEKALRPGTRMLSVSSVDFISGFACDLEALGEFCHTKGILFCVDAMQSLGVMPMDVKRFQIHFLAAGAYKWLLGGLGCGILFISDEMMDLLHPDRVGWKSVRNEEDFTSLHFELKTDALQFEPGILNVPGIYALGASLELILEVGVENIFTRVRSLIDLLVQGLKRRKLGLATPMGNGGRSGILSFHPSSRPGALFQFFRTQRIHVSLRDKKIRLSPHFYNNQDDVDRFFRVLDRFAT